MFIKTGESDVLKMQRIQSKSIFLYHNYVFYKFDSFNEDIRYVGSFAMWPMHDNVHIQGLLFHEFLAFSTRYIKLFILTRDGNQRKRNGFARRARTPKAT